MAQYSGQPQWDDLRKQWRYAPAHTYRPAGEWPRRRGRMVNYHGEDYPLSVEEQYGGDYWRKNVEDFNRVAGLHPGYYKPGQKLYQKPQDWVREGHPNKGDWFDNQLQVLGTIGDDRKFAWNPDWSTDWAAPENPITFREWVRSGRDADEGLRRYGKTRADFLRVVDEHNREKQMNRPTPRSGGTRPGGSPSFSPTRTGYSMPVSEDGAEGEPPPKQKQFKTVFNPTVRSENLIRNSARRQQGARRPPRHPRESQSRPIDRGGYRPSPGMPSGGRGRPDIPGGYST